MVSATALIADEMFKPRTLDRAAVAPPFLTQEKAFDFLGGRGNRGRREKRGIMDECCHGSTGCSWEEYAEYCQHHSRVRV